MTEHWSEKAHCRSACPDAFFPMKGENPKGAKRICAGCPVKEECLEYALAENIKFGVWGGMTERQRRRIRRQREDRTQRRRAA